MEFTTPNLAPALDLSTYVSRLKLTASEQKLLQSVTNELDRLGALVTDFQQGGLARVKQLTWELQQDPTRENVDRVAMACAIENVSDDVKRRVKQAVGPNARRETDKLIDVACRCIDDVANALRADAQKHTEALSSSPFAGDVSDHEAQQRLDKTLQQLGTDRGRVVRDGAALEILQNFGLA